jgi:hypothetical protein
LIKCDYVDKLEDKCGISKMTVKQRKARSDSLTALLQETQASDLSTNMATRDTPGAECLGPYGLKAFDRLFQSRAEWTSADLVLIAGAARALERIHQLEIEIGNGPLMMETASGTKKVHPALPMIEALRTSVKSSLRDANLRARDGSPAVTETASIPNLSQQSGNVASFDQWLGGK